MPRLLFVLWCTALVAADVASAALPSVSERAAAPRVERQQLELANGVRVVLVHRPGGPFVAAGWAVRTGSADDPAELRGLSHLVEHLLHQGSETLGTNDRRAEQRLLREQEELVDRLHLAQDDGKAATIKTTARRLSVLDEQLASIRRKGESAAIAANGGLFGMDALTERDVTLFYAQVPRDRLELWFWLESDRLRAPVFRDFYGELPVVAEELAQRVTSSPGGTAQAMFNEAYWQPFADAKSYAWPAGGVAADLTQARPLHARTHFEQRYGPERLVLVLVGDLDFATARALAERYFTPLKKTAQRSRPGGGVASLAGAAEPNPVEMSAVQLEETCACRPRVLLRWPSVAAGDALEPAYDLLAGILNGRTGRLHRALVQDGKKAFSAYATHAALARAGSFTLAAEALEGTETEAARKPASAADHAGLAQELLEELRRLADDGLVSGELLRVRRRLMTEHARAIESNRGLLLQLLAREAIAAAERVWLRDEQLRRVDEQQIRALARRLVATTPARLELERRPEG